MVGTKENLKKETVEILYFCVTLKYHKTEPMFVIQGGVTEYE